jgi:hypothetical protein
VLSEDTIHVQLGPPPRVWGLPGPAHLLPADVPGEGGYPTRVRNGRAKYAVPLRTAPAQAVSAVPGPVVHSQAWHRACSRAAVAGPGAAAACAA